MKDEDRFEQEVEIGRWTQQEGEAIRAEASCVITEWEAGQPWWSDSWASWEPDEAWTALELPDGWDEP